MESRRRSLLKSLSWRVIALTVTSCVSWALTRDLHTAAAIGLGDTLIKVGVYYAHERVWNHLRFGRIAWPEDYQI
jgi:uncharacterized membrane protein